MSCKLETQKSWWCGSSLKTAGGCCSLSPKAEQIPVSQDYGQDKFPPSEEGQLFNLLRPVAYWSGHASQGGPSAYILQWFKFESHPKLLTDQARVMCGYVSEHLMAQTRQHTTLGMVFST
jgi:hypothetical protein